MKGKNNNKHNIFSFVIGVMFSYIHVNQINGIKIFKSIIETECLEYDENC
jgi:hypothetical protein